MGETRANGTLVSLAREFESRALRLAPFEPIGRWAFVAALAYALWAAGSAFGWLAAFPLVLVALALIFVTINLVSILVMLALGAGLKRSLSHLVSLRQAVSQGAFSFDRKRHLAFLRGWSEGGQKGDFKYRRGIQGFVEAVIILVSVFVAGRSADVQIAAAGHVVAAAAIASFVVGLTPFIYMDGRENRAARFVRNLQAKASPLQRAVSELAALEERSVQAPQWPQETADRVIAASIDRLPLAGLRQRVLLSTWRGDPDDALRAAEQTLRSAPTSELDRATRLVQAAYFAVGAFDDPDTARQLLAIAEATTDYLDDWTYADFVRLEIDMADGNWLSALNGIRDVRSRAIDAAYAARLEGMENTAVDALTAGGFGDAAPQPG
ncbi:MAG: hypothetical protein QM698_16120 [Micropepsaceae bacterium]